MSRRLLLPLLLPLTVSDAPPELAEAGPTRRSCIVGEGVLVAVMAAYRAGALGHEDEAATS